MTEKLKRKDFVSDQDVRWCPGCGDYAVLASVQKNLAETGAIPENTVFVSGIGCSSRFPYYMKTYGFHSIHGRAPAIATGLKLANPGLDVWVITGDGDALSIGGNHLLHALRRNVNINIILFNNRIYGLTKGQYSPTSQQGTKSPTTPFGSVDYPVNPIAFAMGASASFVARAIDVDATGLGEILRRAQEHRGTSLIEVLQNCPIFNDKVWSDVTDRDTATNHQLRIQDGAPLLFANGTKGIRMGADLTPEIVDVGDNKVPIGEILIHRENGSEAYHSMLANLCAPEFPEPLGVIRQYSRATYDDSAHEQVEQVIAKRGIGDLRALLNSGMTWTVGEDGRPQ